MSKEEFKRKLGLELGIDPAKLSDNAEMASFSAWDSMGRIATIAMLDTELGFVSPAGALQNCKTVGDLVALVGPKLDQ